MEREIIKKYARNKFNGKLLKIVLEQIDDYFELRESNYMIRNKYRKGDQVILNSSHLLHGIRGHYNVLKAISKRGIVSPDYFGDGGNHAFCYESAFWTVKKRIPLKKYIINYSGMVAKYNGVYDVIPYKKLDEFVENMKKINHWKWEAESSMEIRFMPSLAKNDNQVAFILKTNNRIAKKMRRYSVFDSKFDRDYALEFVRESERYRFLNGFNEDFFYRTEFIIFGYPANLIEGIIVGRKFEKNKQELNRLKQLFPNSYICNLDGKVIIS